VRLYDRKSFYVLAIVLVVGVIIYYKMGYVAKHFVEKIGSEVLGTQVSIGGMRVDAIKRLVSVSDLHIANPEEYRDLEPYALVIKKINVDLEDIKEGLLVFDNIKIEGTDIFFIADESGSNFMEFKNNIDKYREISVAKINEDDRTAPNVIVNYLKITDVIGHNIVPVANIKMDGVKIPDIEIRNIGEKEQGIRPGRAVALIWNELANSAIKVATDVGFLKGISLYQMNRIENAKKLPDSLNKGIDDSSRAIKGFFGGK